MGRGMGRADIRKIKENIWGVERMIF